MTIRRIQSPEDLILQSDGKAPEIVLAIDAETVKLLAAGLAAGRSVMADERASLRRSYQGSQRYNAALILMSMFSGVGNDLFNAAQEAGSQSAAIDAAWNIGLSKVEETRHGKKA